MALFSFEIILIYSSMIHFVSELYLVGYSTMIYFIRLILKYFNSFDLFWNYSGTFFNDSLRLGIALGWIFVNDLFYIRIFFWSISAALFCFEITLEFSIALLYLRIFYFFWMFLLSLLCLRIICQIFQWLCYVWNYSEIFLNKSVLSPNYFWSISKALFCFEIIFEYYSLICLVFKLLWNIVLFWNYFWSISMIYFALQLFWNTFQWIILL